MSSIKSLCHIPFEKWTSPWRENRGNFSKILWPTDIFLIITLSLLLNLVSEKLFIPFKSMVFHWLQSVVTMRVWPRPLLPLEDILTLWLQRFSVWHRHSGPLHTGNSSLLYHFMLYDEEIIFWSVTPTSLPESPLTRYYYGFHQFHLAEWTRRRVCILLLQSRFIEDNEIWKLVRKSDLKQSKPLILLSDLASCVTV